MTKPSTKKQEIKEKKKHWPKWPRKMTDPKVAKLMDALKTWQDRDSACAYAEVPRSSFYRRLLDYSEFRTKIEEAEHYWMFIVNNQKRKLINEWYRPAIEKELKSKRRKIYWDKLELSGDEENPIVTKNLDLSKLSLKELDELRKDLLK